MNNFLNVRLFSKNLPHNKSLKFRSLSFQIWSNKGHDQEHLKDLEAAKPIVLVFGYAGAPKEKILPFSDLYNRLGYCTLSCTLPIQSLFHGNLPEIEQCADAVVDKLLEKGVERVVFHSLSGNGAHLYQHVNQKIRHQGKRLLIKVNV